MKEHKVTVGNREFPLAFTLKTMIRLQEDLPDFDFNTLDEMMKKPKGMLEMLYQLALSGAAIEDKTLDVSREWIGEHIPASRKKLVEIQVEIVNTLTDGMEMETEEEENGDREIDVVLEDIKKKDGKTG